MEVKTKYLLLFVITGIGLMTFLILNMQVRKETMEAIQSGYEKGLISEQKYKEALVDGTLTYWESFNLRK